VPGVDFIPFNDVEELRSAFDTEVCAITLEVLQGEGGINLVSEEFLRTARELCDQTGALLILDEIQSGMGRTGKWTAYQHFGIQPDITTLAKPLANGVPIGAMLCTEAVARAFKPGMHGTTFGGNPLACAVAIAVVDTLRNGDFLQHNEQVGAYFQQSLRDLQSKHPDAITDVRGLGLMVGCELASADLAKQVLKGMLDRHILINRTHDTVLRFLPPFLVTAAHVDQAIAALDDLLGEAAQQHLPEPQATTPEEVVHD
jgi:acetylornithine/N-succinyldiaminopimelate aminotransferase